MGALSAVHYVLTVAFPSSCVWPTSTTAKLMTLRKIVITTVMVNRTIRQPKGNIGKHNGGGRGCNSPTGNVSPGTSLCGFRVTTFTEQSPCSRNW